MHYRETRSAAAIRKLEEECGLTVQTVEEIATYDVILDMPLGDPPRHGITTVFLTHVDHCGMVRLDARAATADWRTPQAWQDERLHAFVSLGLEKLSLRFG